jgi:WD40 repeat protein
MIIFGWRTCESTTGSGTFQCPHCRTMQFYRHVTYRRWFTLYFLPVIPLGRVGEQVECQGCQCCFSPRVLEPTSPNGPFEPTVPDTHSAIRPWPGSPSEPEVRTWPPEAGEHASAEARSPWEPVRTSSLAIASLVLGLLSPLFLCVCNLSLLTSLTAVITGHLALGEIRRGGGRVDGSGLAVTGLVSGYLLLAVSIAVLILVFSPLRQGWEEARLARLQDSNGDTPPWSVPGDDPLVDPRNDSSTELPPTFHPPFGSPYAPRPHETRPRATIEPPIAPWMPEPPPRRPEPAEMLPDAAPQVNELEIQVVHRFPDIGWQIKSLAFAGNSRWLAAGKMDRTVMMFDVEFGANIGSATKLNELGQIECVAFAKDDTHLFAGGSTGAVQVWPVGPSGQLGSASSLVRHPQAVHVLVPSTASDMVLSGSADGTLIWQTYGRKTARSSTLKPFDRSVLAARLPTDGFEAVATDGRQIFRFDLRRAAELQSQTLAHSGANAAAFSADGTRLAVSTLSEIRLWDTATGREIQTLAHGTRELHWTVRFHPNGHWLMSGGQGRVWVWDVETARCLATVKLDGPFYIQTLAVSNDGTLMAIAPSAAGQTLTVVRLPVQEPPPNENGEPEPEINAP